MYTPTHGVHDFFSRDAITISWLPNFLYCPEQLLLSLSQRRNHLRKRYCSTLLNNSYPERKLITQSMEYPYYFVANVQVLFFEYQFMIYILVMYSLLNIPSRHIEPIKMKRASFTLIGLVFMRSKKKTKDSSMFLFNLSHKFSFSVLNSSTYFVFQTCSWARKYFEDVINCTVNCVLHSNFLFHSV